MFKRQIFITVVIASFIFTGCGTSDKTNDSIDNNFTILEGTVPGTLIEAFCLDGSYYKVNSIQDGSTKHPFSLKIPKNLDCHLVMSTNEDNISTKIITPIRIDTKQAKGSLFRGVSNRVDLDYIPLALDRGDINDSTGDGVSDIPLDVLVVSGTLVVVSLDVDPMDSDNDGIINIYEDDDDDGEYNGIDDDDDGDGIKDIDDEDYKNDSDGDGIDDDDDDDDDNDGEKDDDANRIKESGDKDKKDDSDDDNDDDD